MHEILTIQLGHRANHLATHFWNTQESYFTYDSSQAPSTVDHDVHFRPGIGAQGEETFTPRTLIYDLKGGFGGLRKWGRLYDQQQLDDGRGKEGAQGIWNGNVILQTDPQITQSEYQRSLDEGDPAPQELCTQSVRYWSDFNRVFYHPRSIVPINDYELGSSLMPFEKWESGEELFTSMDRNIDLLDRDVRLWAEECDQMQGIQIYTGADDAWGGFAARYVEGLRDEFGKMAIWTWGIIEEQGKGKRAKQLLRTPNSARTTYEMSTHASMYIPLSMPAAPLPQYVHLDRDSEWHASALLAAAVESMTLPSRLRPGTSRRGILGDLETALNVNGNQRITQLQFSVMEPELDIPHSVDTRGEDDDRVPSKLNLAMTGEDEEKTIDSNLDIDLSGSDDRASPTIRHHHTFGAVEGIRGLEEAVKDEEIEDDKVMFAKKRRRCAGMPVIERYRSPLAFPLLSSFPSIFSHRPDTNNMAVQSSLSTTTGVSRHVKTLQKYANRMANLEERESLSNGLGEICEAYEEGWQSGSDEESDD